MLVRVHEVDAEHVEVALFAAEVLVHANAHDITTEGDHGMAQGRTLPQVDTLVAHMLGALVPLLNECGGHMGVPTCENLHTFGDTCIAVMLYHNVSVGAIGGNDHQVECVQIRSGTMNL